MAWCRAVPAGLDLAGPDRAAVDAPAEPAEDGAARCPQPAALAPGQHGAPWPLAGFRLACRGRTRMALDGLDEHARKLLERTSAPALTVVHHWTGSNDLVLDVPAGEVSEGET